MKKLLMAGSVQSVSQSENEESAVPSQTEEPFPTQRSGGFPRVSRGAALERWISTTHSRLIEWHKPLRVRVNELLGRISSSMLSR